MEHQMDIAKVDRYSESLADKLCNEFFVAHDFIDGKQITKFTSVDQINYFILENLFGNWIEETSNLESPYFDYENEEVQSAIRTLMNKLSFHIQVDRDNLEPLVIAAIKDTIHLALAPFHFFTEEYFTQERGKISLEELSELNRYIKLNGFLITELIKEVEKFNVDELPVTDLLDRFKEIYTRESEHLTNAEYTISKLDALVPLNIEDIIKKTAAAKESEPNGSAGTINDGFAESKPETVHSSLQSGGDEKVADTLKKGKVEKIGTAIAVNDKFKFVKELFNGENQSYDEAIVALDACESFESADSLIKKDYAPKYKWDMSKPEVQDFMDIVSRKF